MNGTLYTVIPSTLSSLASLVFFCSYSRLPTKTLTIKMTFITGLSAFFFHIAMLLFIFWKLYEPTSVVDDTITTSTFAVALEDILVFFIRFWSHFSIFWATNMAFCIERIYHTAASETYFNRSLAVLLSLTVIVTGLDMGLSENSDRNAIGLVTLVGPLIFVLFLYRRSSSNRELYLPTPVVIMQLRMKDLFWFVLLPFSTLGLVLLYKILLLAFLYDISTYTILEHIISTVVNSLGFAITVVFCVHRRRRSATINNEEEPFTNPKRENHKTLLLSDDDY